MRYCAGYDQSAIHASEPSAMNHPLPTLHNCRVEQLATSRLHQVLHLPYRTAVRTACRSRDQ